MASPKHSTEVGSGENQSGFGRWWSPAVLMGVVLIVFGAWELQPLGQNGPKITYIFKAVH